MHPEPPHPTIHSTAHIKQPRNQNPRALNRLSLVGSTIEYLPSSRVLQWILVLSMLFIMILVEGLGSSDGC